VNVGKCAASGSLLLDAGGTGGLAEHPALGNKNNMTVGKLFLKLPCESIQPTNKSISHSILARNLPLLHLPERLQLGNRYEDHDSLLSTANIYSTRSGDLQRSQLYFELGDVVLQVNERLGDASFYLVWGGRGCICGAEDLMRHSGGR